MMKEVAMTHIYTTIKLANSLVRHSEDSAQIIKYSRSSVKNLWLLSFRYFSPYDEDSKDHRLMIMLKCIISVRSFC
jgi:hypothetical protein